MDETTVGTRHQRVELVLYERADSRQHRELGAFARYCVARIEREIGQVARWTVRVAPALGGFTSTVRVEDGNYRAEVTAVGFDGPLAIWDAMCRLEQGLREAKRLRRS